MKVLFDHNLPKRLRGYLGTYEINTTREMGWETLANGALLMATARRFEAFVSIDKNIEHEQKSSLCCSLPRSRVFRSCIMKHSPFSIVCAVALFLTLFLHGTVSADINFDPNLLQKLHDNDVDDIPDDTAGRIDVYAVYLALCGSGYKPADRAAIDATDAEWLQASNNYFKNPVITLFPFPLDPNTTATMRLVATKGPADPWVQELGKNLFMLILDRGSHASGSTEPKGLSDDAFAALADKNQGTQSPRAVAIEHYLKPRLVQPFDEKLVKAASNVIDQEIGASSLQQKDKDDLVNGAGEHQICWLSGIKGISKQEGQSEAASASAAKQLQSTIIRSLPESMLSFMPGLWTYDYTPEAAPKLPDDYRGPGTLLSVERITAWGALIDLTNSPDEARKGIPNSVLDTYVYCCTYTTARHDFVNQRYFWWKNAPAGWDKVKTTIPGDSPLLKIGTAVNDPPPRDPEAVQAAANAAKTPHLKPTGPSISDVKITKVKPYTYAFAVMTPRTTADDYAALLKMMQSQIDSGALVQTSKVMILTLQGDTTEVGYKVVDTQAPLDGIQIAHVGGEKAARVTIRGPLSQLSQGYAKIGAELTRQGLKPSKVVRQAYIHFNGGEAPDNLIGLEVLVQPGE